MSNLTGQALLWASQERMLIRRFRSSFGKALIIIIIRRRRTSQRNRVWDSGKSTLSILRGY